jgi:hypothetical protein
MQTATTILYRSAWLAWLLIGISGAGLAWMIGDSTPPFRLTGYVSNVPHRGELLRVDATVWRDLERNCSVQFSRHIFDAAGVRWDVLSSTNMTAAALRQLDEQAPGHLRLAVPIPAGAAVGPAKLVTPLEYQCNPWHGIRPIESTMTIDFEVLP